MENQIRDLRKLERKRKKFAIRLKISKGVECIDRPSPNIVLCNVGQATGLQKETVLKILEDLGGIKPVSFIADKGESYSFVLFQNKEEAEVFFRMWNGKTIIDDSSPVYMSYVKKVPNPDRIFSIENPDGLSIFEDFITEEEEKKFVEIFDWSSNVESLSKRLVKHYGYKFRYGSSDIDLSAPLEDTIPFQCNILWKRLKERGIEFDIPDQLTVNKYLPGHGIPSHVDRHSPFGSTIMALSLCAPVVMDWKHHKGTYLSLVVPQRSMLVMQGAARYDWQHGIRPTTSDPVIKIREFPERARVRTNDTVRRRTRISLTFRKTRVGPCDCSFSMLCDLSDEEELMDDDNASELEDVHVHKVYEKIASHFSSTRRAPWPLVEEFLRSAPPGAVLLDLGAGNGKNLLPRSDLLQIPCERSGALAAECAQRVREKGAHGDCVRMDMLRAPLRDGCADMLLCVAVLHHFSTPARRSAAVSNIARLLRPGGRALITVWAKDQSKSNYIIKGKKGTSTVYSTVGAVRLPVHENRTAFLYNDLLVPWKLRAQDDREGAAAAGSETTLLRYYHVFKEGELEALCTRPYLQVESSRYDEGNWCVVCKKI